LNSPMALPIDRPMSGSRFGPKMIRATTKIMRSSGNPSEPSMAAFPRRVCNHPVNSPGGSNTPRV
jgi:hypothetical protein